MTLDDVWSEVFETKAGQWAFRVLVGDVEMACGVGYDTMEGAQEVAESVLLGFAACLDQGRED